MYPPVLESVGRLSDSDLIHLFGAHLADVDHVLFDSVPGRIVEKEETRLTVEPPSSGPAGVVAVNAKGRSNTLPFPGIAP